MDEDSLAESESRLMEEQVMRFESCRFRNQRSRFLCFCPASDSRGEIKPKTFLRISMGKSFELSLGSRESGLQTPGWKSLVDEEHKREEAELVFRTLP
jgi:hypothetical protein